MRRRYSTFTCRSSAAIAAVSTGGKSPASRAAIGGVAGSTARTVLRRMSASIGVDRNHRIHVHTAQVGASRTFRSVRGSGRMATATATVFGTREVEGVRVPAGLASAPRCRGRVSRGHLVMALAGIVGVVLTFAVLRQRDGETAVLVAAHEIRAGESISASDFRAVRVTLTPEVLATVAQADDLRLFRGRIAGSTLAEGELVTTRT